jgi:hypothetical protein
VGSLPRAARGETLGIRDIIRMQKEAGFDVINDGEWSRSDYVSDTLGRIEGFSAGGELPSPSHLVDMPMASDMLDVPSHAKRFSELNGLVTLNPNKPVRSSLAFVSAPRYMPGGAELVQAAMKPFLDAVDAEAHPREDCFWTAPSPGTVALFCRGPPTRTPHPTCAIAIDVLITSCSPSMHTSDISTSDTPPSYFRQMTISATTRATSWRWPRSSATNTRLSQRPASCCS